ncbi:MAG: DUF2911 domain-containing protein [Microscillaceae bacterium]
MALTAWFVLASAGQAQIVIPAPSPGVKTVQNFGLGQVTLEYSRPAAKGRVIFAADGLVPFGQVWRTGANSATKITFSEDVKIGGKDLKAGAYAVLSIPNANAWAVHFYPYETGSWNSYTEKTPALIAEAKVKYTNFALENFSIDLQNIGLNTAELVFAWEKTMAVLPLEVDVDKKILSNIDRVMAGPSNNDYYAAASYYHDTGKDLNKALEFINKATAGENPAFWQLRRKSLILADLGKKAEAIAVAKQSLEAAQKAGNQDYVRMNEKSIAEWSAKE